MNITETQVDHLLWVLSFFQITVMGDHRSHYLNPDKSSLSSSCFKMKTLAKQKEKSYIFFNRK